MFVSLTQRWNPFNRDTALRGDVLGDYADLFATPRFQVDLRNTAVFTLLFLAASVVVGLLLAVLVHHVVDGRAFIFVYEQMFRALRYNLGAAASIVMLLLVCAVVVPYLARTYTREEH